MRWHNFRMPFHLWCGRTPLSGTGMLEASRYRCRLARRDRLVAGLGALGVAALTLCLACLDGGATSRTEQGVAGAVLLAAGDIGRCDATSDQDTAALVAGLAGTVATLGDTVYEAGSPEQFAHCYEPKWGRFKARTRPAAGNHDYETPGAAGYFGYFGAAAGAGAGGYYSYALGAWHVVVLNSNCAAVGGCQAGSAQEQWLRADLAAHPSRCTLAYWHHPLFSSGAHGGDSEVQPLWQALYEAGAEVVLNGHEHLYERFAPQDPAGRPDPQHGLRQFIVGTGGGSLQEDENPQEHGHDAANIEVMNNTTYGVLRLVLRPTGYDWQFLPAIRRSGAAVANAAKGADSAPSRYRDTVLADEPVSYWRLGISLGLVARELVGGRNGMYLGGITLGQAGALANDPDPAAWFDGRSGSVSVSPYPASLVPSSVSVEAWVKLTGDNEQQNTIVSKGSSEQSGWRLALDLRNGRRNLWWEIGDGHPGHYHVYVASLNLVVGQWYHVVATFDGQTQTLGAYLNGEPLPGVLTIDGTLHSDDSALQIGQSPHGAFFNGLLDEVAVYDVALTAEQVKAHYAVGQGRPYTLFTDAGSDTCH